MLSTYRGLATPLNIRAKNLFKRCITCPPLNEISCSTTCSKDQICVLTNPNSCTECPSYQCQTSSSSGQIKHKPNSDSGPEGPIAGGVVGGVFGIALLGFLVWWFFIRKKQREQSHLYESVHLPLEKAGELTPFQRSARSRTSTHSAHSTADTVLTRASNVIQIAYIPGVTNIEEGQPPVPPIPASIQSIRQSQNDEPLMFHAGDLRNSAYTGISDFNRRTRTSLTPSLARASMSSLAVRDNAVTVVKARPNLVSVRLGMPTGTTTPPVPQLDYMKFGQSDSNNSSGSSTPMRPVLVQITGSADGVRIPGTSVTTSAASPIKPKALTITKSKLADGSPRPGLSSAVEMSHEAKRLSTIPQSIASSSAASTPRALTQEFRPQADGAVVAAIHDVEALPVESSSNNNNSSPENGSQHNAAETLVTLETPKDTTPASPTNEYQPRDSSMLLSPGTKTTTILSPFSDKAEIGNQSTPATPSTPSTPGTDGPFSDKHAV